MLQPAIKYKEELEKLRIEALYDKKNLYWINQTYRDINLNIESNEWLKLQYVSIINHEIIGYISSSLEEPEHYVSNMSIILYDEKNIFTYTKDIFQFIKMIFNDMRFYKITWSCVTKNPAYSIYKKFIKNHGGREVGIFLNEMMLIDHKLYDIVWFELFKEEFKC